MAKGSSFSHSVPPLSIDLPVLRSGGYPDPCGDHAYCLSTGKTSVLPVST